MKSLDQIQELKGMFVVLVLAFAGMLQGCSTRNQLRSEAAWVQYRESLLHDVWSRVFRYYYDREFNGVNWIEAGEAASREMAHATTMEDAYAVLTRLATQLQDKHTFVLDPRKNEEFSRDSYKGVGFSTSAHPQEPDLQIVIRVAADSPAELAGIKPGWLFLNPGQVEDRLYRFLDRNEQVRELTLNPVVIPRSRSAREFRILEGNLAYLRFEAFDKGLGEWLRRHLFATEHAEGVIVDLRWNPGGYVTELIQALECFLPPDTLIGVEVTSLRPRHELRTKARYERAPIGTPLVVLISEYSASSSEILARVIQHYGRGIIVGTQPSAGEVMISPSWELAGGGLLRISVKDFRDPEGKRLQNLGVEPDVAVTAQSFFEFRRGRDPILDRAVSLLRFGH